VSSCGGAHRNITPPTRSTHATHTNRHTGTRTHRPPPPPHHTVHHNSTYTLAVNSGRTVPRVSKQQTAHTTLLHRAEPANQQRRRRPDNAHHQIQPSSWNAAKGDGASIRKATRVYHLTGLVSLLNHNPGVHGQPITNNHLRHAAHTSHLTPHTTGHHSTAPACRAHSREPNRAAPRALKCELWSLGFPRILV
jgi:hypothetical protein